MLTAVKRLSFWAGLVMFTIGTWFILRLDFFRTEFSRIIQTTRHGQQSQDLPVTHTIIRSVSTPDGAYFSIDVGGELAMNPNVIPHPFMENTWILVAQLRQETQYFAELVCNTRFDGTGLGCTDSPSKLPIAATTGDKCTGDLAYIGLNQGPHDARVFYGPEKPYTIYGSNSEHTCFGQWIHDFRNLVEWGYDSNVPAGEFSSAVELQRPPPWSAIEKNWFLFWDVDGQIYVHYDLVPGRVFAKVDEFGTVGPDLGLITQGPDNACMEKYMPGIGPELESIHQATNSLSITMCKRSDMWCHPEISNTFVFTIFQHKKYFNFHAVYEPYVLVFEQTPPFGIRAISKKPFWISGRKVRSSHSPDTDSVEGRSKVDSTPLLEKEEMLYVTSMSWKNHGQTYHGYVDDVLFIAFGIEDETTAAIDIVAGDLIQDLGSC